MANSKQVPSQTAQKSNPHIRIEIRSKSQHNQPTNLCEIANHCPKPNSLTAR